MRESRRSRSGMVACCAGTKQPICASTTMRATCLMKTVLPEPLGPETTNMFTAGVKLQSFGTKDEHEPSCLKVLIMACRPVVMANAPTCVSALVGMMCGPPAVDIVVFDATSRGLV